MSDIDIWLQSLGLEKYGEVLASHDIDLAVAPDLTEQDLEKLGLSLGHRRKFIAAAAKLRAWRPRRPSYRRRVNRSLNQRRSSAAR